MKVLLINGSPRKDGNTQVALGEIAQTLQQEGVETETVWIGTKPVRGCCACGKCKELAGKAWPDGHKGCAFDDDVANMIGAKYAAADGVIFGSPVYYGQPNGALLCVMQRTFQSFGADLQFKPAAGVAICRRGGGTAALESLQMPMQIMSMPLVTSQYWNIAYGNAAGETKLDGEGLQTMRQLGRNMAWMLKRLQGKEVPEKEPRLRTNFVR